MREKEEIKKSPGTFGLVDSAGGGATFQQGHREAVTSITGEE